MKNLKEYIKGDFKSINVFSLEGCKPVELCTTAEDFIQRGKALLALNDKDGYFDAFMCFEDAVRIDPDNFEARLGEYKSWYLYSKCVTDGTGSWDPLIGDLYRSLLFSTPAKYKEAMEAMYKSDKDEYTKRGRQNG